MLLVVFPSQLVAQAFGLRTLAALLRPKPAPSLDVAPTPRVMGLGRIRRVPNMAGRITDEQRDTQILQGLLGPRP